MKEKKKIGLGKKIGIGVGIVFLLIVVIGIASVGIQQTGNTESTTQTQSSETQMGSSKEYFEIGEPVVLGDLVYTVNSVFVTDTLGDYFSTFADGAFVVLEISIENKGKEGTYITTEHFKIVDYQDRSYDWASDSIYLSSMGLQPLEILKKLGPGLKTTGYIAFDVPADDKGLVLRAGGAFSEKKNIRIGDVESI